MRHLPLKGGSSEKLGNLYERLWIARAFLSMVGGTADSIRIERLDAEKAEFVVTTGQQRTFHQAKMGNPTGRWSLAELASRRHGLIQAIGEALSKDDTRFVFVSGSHARELDELCAAAGDAASLEELERDFLSKNRHGNLKRLCAEWWRCSRSTAFDRLKRIQVSTIDDGTLERDLYDAVPGKFLAEPRKVVAEILRVVDDAVNQTVTRHDLISSLASRGYRLRQLRHPQQAGAAIQKATDERYLAHVKRRLIRRSLLKRPAAEEVLERLTGTSSDSVITGAAGSGKTACAIQIADSLRERQVPVLVFRLDRLHPHLTTPQLGEHLGLEESPALVLAAAAETHGGHGVLIIDQLDAVSTMSGRSTGAFELVEQLLLEARNFRESTSIHTVVVCRTFDLENDSGLRQLIPDSASRVDVSQFSIDQVKSILTDEGYDLDGFDPRQIDLLRLPQNVSLFLGAGFTTDHAPAFRTARDLFDHYWDSKRRLVEKDARSDQWLEAVQTLSDRMNSEQHLSVAKEVLDGVSPIYLDRMTSEGVLTFDGRRYGFGHESFFDYCFARLFFRRGEGLVPLLIGREQHLFRRAQVRQVLAYLRDADPSRYIREIRDLLSDERIRIHVKDLVFAALAGVPFPRENEWMIWKERIDPEIRAIKEEEESPDALSTLAWRHFFGSRSWFTFVEKSGVVEAWLAAESDPLADMAVSYLRVHQRHAPGRTAALLEPYVGRGGGWPRRLRFFVQRIGPRKNVRLFELFLRLIDNGTLDRVEGESPLETAVWDSLHGVEESNPQWVAQVLAHQLRRRLQLLPATNRTFSLSGLLGHDPAAQRMFRLSAERDPGAFVQHVLPAVLEVSDRTATGETGPKPDGVWSFDAGYDTSSLDEACLSGLEGALATLAGHETDLTGIVAELRQRETNTSNRLLLTLYAANPKRYGDEAILLLCDEPWRLSCRFRGKQHWYTTELVRAALSHCKGGTRRTLEDTFLSYADAFEGTTSGYKRFGWSQFALLLAIPNELRSSRVNRRLRELSRRFPDSPAAPRRPTVGRARSPIDENSAEKMTDEHWLRALRKYSSKDLDDFLSGSSELADVLRGRAKEEPERFARLALRFPSNTPSTYFEGVLRGLRESSVESELRVSVCRNALAASPEHCGRTVAQALGEIESPLSDDAIGMLHYLATEHQEPAEETWQKEAPKDGQSWGDNILTCGLNSTRGNAAYTMAKLIGEDATCIDAFRATLHQMIQDRSTAVMSCVLATLTAVARHEPKMGLRLFLGATLSDDRVLATQHALPLIRLALREDFARIRPVVERMLQSSEPEVCEAGSTHAGIAALLHPDGTDLANKATSLTARHRLGLAKVAAANIGNSECRDWCEDRLLQFFGDQDEAVQREAASCFRHLEGTPLEEYEDVIEDFSRSEAFKSLPGPLLLALEKTRQRLPGLTYTICRRFLDTFRGEVARSRRTVTKLIFRTYQQHQTDEWGPRLLELIDRLCLDGVFEVRDALNRFDR